jgi:hypothetical protein
MKKVLLLAGLFVMTGYFTMAQQHHPSKKDSTGTKPAHVKEPRKATDTTHAHHNMKKH